MAHEFLNNQMDNNDVVSATKCIIQDYGIDILQNKNRFLSLFTDYAPTLRKEKKLISNLFDFDFYNVANKLKSQDESKQNMLLMVMKNHLENDAMLSEMASKLILNWIIEIFNCSMPLFAINEGVESIVKDDEQISNDNHNNFDESMNQSDNNQELALPNGGLYNGEAFAGKPHGQGKCIYPSGDSYVGSWAFGQYNGFGKYNWADGNYFEGEWKDGNRNGQGTFFYSDGVSWQGKWKDNNRWCGEGTWRYKNGTGYNGKIKDGKRNGQGTLYYSNGDSWSGEWKNDNPWNGNGKHILDNGDKYEGELKDGYLYGKSKFIFKAGGYYEGELIKTKRNGHGKEVYESGSWYEGEYVDNKRCGQGKMSYKNGNQYDGMWKNNNRHGYGIMTWSNGSTWTGEWQNDKPWTGKGYWKYDKGYYDGEMKDGKYDGQGKIIYTDGSHYEGMFKNGGRHGTGTMVWKNIGSWTGEWRNNSCWNGRGKCKYTDNTVFEGELIEGCREGIGIHIYTDGGSYQGEFRHDEFHGKGTMYFKEGTRQVGVWKEGKFWKGKYYDIDGSVKGKTSGGFYEKKESGCYVATCVYGSYDCPQVWTLRRFRDYRLATAWYGRAFIALYYAISPTCVKIFGESKWFKSIFKQVLDRMVATLRLKGFEDTPYQDRF